ncbi:serine/arginine-rich splicing factor 4-like [Prorops nasuta]|uniref:serine/arginine-rich splicing factor 4-like n=1 Tax=Prorops nasuta TaxID=863751 RepID=UPI0034CF2375
MAPTRKNGKKRDQRKIKSRRRPNIEELVCKYYPGSMIKAAREDASNSCDAKCPYCKHQERHKQVSNAFSARKPMQKGRNTFLDCKSNSLKHQHRSKRHQAFLTLNRDLHNSSSGKAKNYIRAALNFGLESGYLVPSNNSCRVLRVSSDLMQSKDQRYSGRSPSPAVGHERDRERSAHRSVSRLDEYEVQDARRRRRRRSRRRRGRSRSRSRRRRRYGRKRGGSDNPEDTGENVDQYGEADDGREKESSNNNEYTDREEKGEKSDPGDKDKNDGKDQGRANASDVSIDDEYSEEDDDEEDEEDTKETGGSKS